MRDDYAGARRAGEGSRASRKAAGVTPLWWPRERFFNGDGSMTACPSVIDLTGRHRFLVYGPYDPIEAGHWRATVTFDLCADGARRPFLVQFGADPEFTTVELKATRRPGRQAVTVEHRMGQDSLAQVRIYLARAAFHGEFRLVGVSVEKIAEG